MVDASPRTQADPGRAVIHVGAPKTGTTFLQETMWANRDRLLEAGVEILGSDQGRHYRAGKDLRDIPFEPANPGVSWVGAWDRLCEIARLSPSPVVVISDEHLAAATPQQAQRAARSLAPRHVHVVYASRALPGLLPSEWQEYVKHGSSAPYGEWLDDVLSSTTRGPGDWFWSVHDPTGVITRWTAGVPVAQVHLLTMPPPGAPRDEIWRRFAATLPVDPTCAPDLPHGSNPSLGLAATEVLRRVNAALPEDFPSWHRTGVVRDVLANRVLNPIGGGGRPAMSAELGARVQERMDHVVEAIPELGCDVVGDLADLRAPVPSQPPESAGIDGDQLADVSIRALAGLAEQVAQTRDSRRQAELELDALLGEARYNVEHPIEALVTRVKRRVLQYEDENEALGQALSAYRRLRDRARR